MIPTKIRLLEKEYIIYEQEIINENPLQVGELQEHQDCILISSLQSNENKKITLLHELVHTLFIQTGHSEYDNDEDLIDCIALGMYSLIKNNDLEFIKEK